LHLYSRTTDQGCSLGILIFCAATFVGAGNLADADGPCVNGLPVDHTYANANWHTGGYQYHGSTIMAVKGLLRTYNGFVANTPYPYTGAESAWLMLEDNSGYAQTGWVKWPNSPDIYNAVVFTQYTTAAGDPFPLQYQAAGTPIYPPTIYEYQVTYVPTGGGFGYFEMRRSGTTWWTTETIAWAPTYHDAASEVFNYTGDQLAGDTTAHMIFQYVSWSPDLISWYGSTFGTPAGTYFAGRPRGTNPPRTWDALSYTDGSNFDSWDTRCP
jgi:hypothetical protein